jgi:hypothetical protein
MSIDVLKLKDLHDAVPVFLHSIIDKFMRFKIWLQMQENLAGPGGGVSSFPIDQLSLNKDIMSKGAGAFPYYGDMPPEPAKTATAGYVDPRFTTKKMKKRMRQK